MLRVIRATENAAGKLLPMGNRAHINTLVIAAYSRWCFMQKLWKAIKEEWDVTGSSKRIRVREHLKSVIKKVNNGE